MTLSISNNLIRLQLLTHTHTDNKDTKRQEEKQRKKSIVIQISFKVCLHKFVSILSIFLVNLTHEPEIAYIQRSYLLRIFSVDEGTF